MTIKKIILLLFISGIFVASYSQEDDFGIWYGVSAEHKLVKRLEIDMEANVRTYKNASKIDEMFLEAGLKYKFNKYLNTGASYRYSEFIEKDNYFHGRHKWFVDVTGSLPLGNFELSARVRFQERYKTYFGKKVTEGEKKPDSHLRYKMKLDYNIPSFPVNPYIAAEIFCPVFQNTTRKIDKDRFIAGLEYKIAKKHSVDLEYIFQRDFLPRISDINIISVSYNIKF